MEDQEKVYLVGYWNCSKENPEISFNIPKDEKDSRKIVLITIEDLPNTRQNLSKHDINKKLKEIKKENRNLLNISRRLK